MGWVNPSWMVMIAAALMACGQSVPEPAAPKPGNSTAEEAPTLDAVRKHIGNVHVAYKGSCNGQATTSVNGGTAFPVGPYLWVTAAHVVAEGESASCGTTTTQLTRDKVTILLEPDVDCFARVVSLDKQKDIALVETLPYDRRCVRHRPRWLKLATKSRLGALRAKQELTAIGYPSESLDLLKAVAGSVSFKSFRNQFPQKLSAHFFDRIIDPIGSGRTSRSIVTSYQAVPGDSGSPLINDETLEIIGVVVERVPGHTKSVPADEIESHVSKNAERIKLIPFFNNAPSHGHLYIQKLDPLDDSSKVPWVRIDDREWVTPGRYGVCVFPCNAWGRRAFVNVEKYSDIYIAYDPFRERLLTYLNYFEQ